MTVELIDDPAAMAATGTVAGRFAAALAARGTQTYIPNATSRLLLLHAAGHALPVTVDDGGYGRSYVASPHSAYVPYARREMDLVGMTHGRWPALGALAVLDAVLRGVQINRAVHLDNWLLSTNLHGDWHGESLAGIRGLLARRFPDHFLILRSLDDWSCPRLLDAARNDGWILVPARQIWVVDDLERDWRPRHNCANDRRALARSGLVVDDTNELTAQDRARIAQLYALLYLDKYCALNPVFNPDFIGLMRDTGMVSYRLAREPDGQIVAVAGMLARGPIMTPPVVGYDTARPKQQALYRIASYLFSEWAEQRGLGLHGSAGAADFKRQRGARGVIEYMAVYAGHLSRVRRATVQTLAAILERSVVPMMQREGW